MGVGYEGSGDVCGGGHGLVRVLVSVVRPITRERPNRESKLCGY